MTKQPEWSASQELDRLIEQFGDDVDVLREAAGRADWDHLAQAVHRARVSEGVTQSELARRAGVSASVVSRIEAGVVKQPDARTVDALAIALGRSAHDLDLIARGDTMTAY